MITPTAARHLNGWQVVFDTNVYEFMLQELCKKRSVEEGGKYVGFLACADSALARRLGMTASRALVVVDFLPSGPKAVRTAVELQPDGEYQESLFRRLERREQRIEHLGSWHSHHCNGLETLSEGDVRGYRRTVNREAYRLDVFLASLVKRIPSDIAEVGWIDHYLFFRGRDQYYKITDLVSLIDYPTTFGELTGHAPRHVSLGVTRGEADASPVAVDDDTEELWFEGQEGRDALAADMRFFKEAFGASVTATRRDNQITISGKLGDRLIAITYPRFTGNDRVEVVVSSAGEILLQMSARLQHREMALTAALAALRL